MTTTLDGVTKKRTDEPSAEQRAAAELVRMATEQGPSLTGPDGLLMQLRESVLETSLNEEMTEHLGHEKHGQPVAGKVGDGTRAKTVLTENTGQAEIDVRRDRAGTFEPQIVKKRQRRLNGVDEVVLSLYAKGLTAGETDGGRWRWLPWGEARGRRAGCSGQVEHHRGEHQQGGGRGEISAWQVCQGGALQVRR